MRKIILLVVCLAGAALNIGLNRLCMLANIPLYLDTVFTIAVTLMGGLFFGSLCGALTNLIHHSVWFWGWEGYLFTLCNIATACITWLFIRIFPRELRLFAETDKTAPPVQSLNKGMDRMIVLILLSFALCIAMSVLGGFLTALILSLSPAHAGERGLSVLLSTTLFNSNLPLVLVEILSRIPINIIDRLISAFGGYAIALACAPLFKERSGKT